MPLSLGTHGSNSSCACAGDSFFPLALVAGGPPVVAPTRRGFGSVILQDMAKQSAERVIVDYRPDGLNYQLHVELRKIQTSASPAIAAS